MDVISGCSLIQGAATVTKRGGHAMGICNTHFMPDCMINQGGASGHQTDKTTERAMLGQLLKQIFLKLVLRTTVLEETVQEMSLL